MLRITDYRFRVAAIVLLIFLAKVGFAQPGDQIQKLIASLTIGPIPDDLLATKTIALYDPAFTVKELNQIQSGFERTGVDAVIYYPIDLPTCNPDVQKSFTDYLVKREIKYLAFLQKKPTGPEYTFTAFSKTKSLINVGQPCWKIAGNSINDISMDIYRTALNSQKRINMLVSPIPEFNLTLRFIRGTRGEYYALDLKVDKLAVIKSGDIEFDQALEEALKVHYPFKYQLFEPGTEETEVRQKGFLFSLISIHTRGSAAMELLGYNMSKAGSAISSVSYPNGEMQLKTIDANESVYKFYFKHLQNENIFLGTRWDADTDCKQALINQIKGLKKELRVN